jgi:putative addiction module CopG family antidote
MSISLTPEQEHFIQTKLSAGKYHSVKEILKIALRLLDEYDRANAEWVEDVGQEYPVWSPYGCSEAANTLMNLLAAKQKE